MFDVKQLNVTQGVGGWGKKQVVGPVSSVQQCAVFNERLAQQQLPGGTSLTQTHKLSAG